MVTVVGNHVNLLASVQSGMGACHGETKPAGRVSRTQISGRCGSPVRKKAILGRFRLVLAHFVCYGGF
jgi:hypothetical protein